MPPATRSKAPGGATGGAATGGSPSPYVLFRGRLSFAPQADSGRGACSLPALPICACVWFECLPARDPNTLSHPPRNAARKFDRPTTAGKAAGAGLKRKLLISPGGERSRLRSQEPPMSRWGWRVSTSAPEQGGGAHPFLNVPAALTSPPPAADISAAFPSVRKPAAKQRRRSVGDMGDARGAAGAPEEAAASPAAAAAAETAADGSGTGHYWSDPLPLPQSACRQAGAGARGALPDDDMLDTAASPASSGGAGGCCSPAGVGMDTCCQRSPAPPALSPLRECRCCACAAKLARVPRAFQCAQG